MNISHKFIKIIPATVLLILSACASVPKESIDLSAKLNRQIYALQQVNVGLITQVYEDKERQMTEYLDSVWFPAYLNRLFGKQEIQDLWNMAVESEDMAVRTEVTAIITREAIERYNEEKDFLILPILAERDSMIAIHSTEYDKAREMNDAIGRLLESQYEVKSAYYRMLPEGHAERLDSALHNSLGRLDSRPRQIEAGTGLIKETYVQLRDSLNQIKMTKD